MSESKQQTTSPRGVCRSLKATSSNMSQDTNTNEVFKTFTKLSGTFPTSSNNSKRKKRKNNNMTNEQFEKAMEECERHLGDAHKSLRKACSALGVHIPVPYNIEKAKLETKHALKRFQIRRARLQD